MKQMDVWELVGLAAFTMLQHLTFVLMMLAFENQ